MEQLVGIVGDYNPGNVTHQATQSGLTHAGLSFAWVPTPEVSVDRPEGRLGRYAGLFIAPANPYRHMAGALASLRLARERGIPLVGT